MFPTHFAPNRMGCSTAGSKELGLGPGWYDNHTVCRKAGQLVTYKLKLQSVNFFCVKNLQKVDHKKREHYESVLS